MGIKWGVLEKFCFLFHVFILLWPFLQLHSRPHPFPPPPNVRGSTPIFILLIFILHFYSAVTFLHLHLMAPTNVWGSPPIFILLIFILLWNFRTCTWGPPPPNVWGSKPIWLDLNKEKLTLKFLIKLADGCTFSTFSNFILKMCQFYSYLEVISNTK